MKNSVRLALLCMAATAAPAIAQNASPMCGATNLDQSRNIFTIMNPAAGAVNQQCYLTVYPAGAMPDMARQYPSSYLAEGRYLIELSGGGGGGGGGGSTNQGNSKPNDQGGGGGGAGAAPSRTFQYLSPGVYKLTIGTGGFGGSGNGGRTGAGNPTSLTNVGTGQVIAGFAGADVSSQQTRAAGDGRGGVGAPGGSSGGDGAGSSMSRPGTGAQSGSALQTSGYNGMSGQAGNQSGSSATRDSNTVAQSSAGGGGGAGVGSGGTGDSASANTVAGVGDLGGGGGGGRGGFNAADAGGAGGNGFIRLSMAEPARQAVAPAVVAPAPQVIVLAPVRQKYSLSSDALFGFGKAALKPSGQAKLDELVGQIRDVNVESITDVGHADRIGSSELNQRLSERRAESVKAYLVSKGIPSSRIAASGVGETQPVTGSDDCKGPASAKVIACLQPDRRVDIEVVGSKR